jgi:hypothetical protein
MSTMRRGPLAGLHYLWYPALLDLFTYPHIPRAYNYYLEILYILGKSLSTYNKREISTLKIALMS